jgi:ribosomal protein L20
LPDAANPSTVITIREVGDVTEYLSKSFQPKRKKLTKRTWAASYQNGATKKKMAVGRFLIELKAGSIQISRKFNLYP